MKKIFSDCMSIIGIVLIFIIVVFAIGTSIPEDVAKEITPTDGPVPVVYEVKTDTTYYYSVWVLPNGERTVFLCHQNGTGQSSTFGMARAVHPDGTPVTPEELGIVIPGDADAVEDKQYEQ